jgi:hypothetical protein
VVTCQRFFTGSHQITYFAVRSPEKTKARRVMEGISSGGEHESSKGCSKMTADVIRAELFGQLAIHRNQDRAASDIVVREVDKTEASPWLQLTRWSTYLDGYILFV